MTFAALLAGWAQRWPNALALVDEASGRAWTFARLAAQCARAGMRLAGAGLEPGARVGLLADAEPEALFAGYGTMAAGFVRVPLDPSRSAAELGAQLVDAEAEALAFGAGRRALAEEIGRALSLRLFSLAELAGEARAAWPALPPEALASLHYTGDARGGYKAVMHSHASLRAAIVQAAAARGTAAGEVMLHVQPLWPMAALTLAAHLAAGGRVVLGAPFEPARFVAQLKSHRAACAQLEAAELARLVRTARVGELAGSEALRAIDVGGAPAAPEVLAAALAAIGPRIGIAYGFDEAPWSCYQPAAALAAPAGRLDEARLRAVGRPVRGCEARISETGEVLLRGPHLMRGYWKRRELTGEALRAGWLHTGDAGSLDADGVLSIIPRSRAA